VDRKPIVLCSRHQDKDGLEHVIRTNREGLLKLRKMINRALAFKNCEGSTFYLNTNRSFVYQKQDKITILEEEE